MYIKKIFVDGLSRRVAYVRCDFAASRTWLKRREAGVGIFRPFFSRYVASSRGVRPHVMRTVAPTAEREETQTESPQIAHRKTESRRERADQKTRKGRTKMEDPRL